MNHTGRVPAMTLMSPVLTPMTLVSERLELLITPIGTRQNTPVSPVESGDCVYCLSKAEASREREKGRPIPAVMTKKRVRYYNTSSLAASRIPWRQAASAYNENICPTLPVGLVKTYAVNPAEKPARKECQLKHRPTPVAKCWCLSGPRALVMISARLSSVEMSVKLTIPRSCRSRLTWYGNVLVQSYQPLSFSGRIGAGNVL